jgi:hypothetical protein
MSARLSVYVVALLLVACEAAQVLPPPDTTRPTARVGAAAAWDPVRARLLYFGGEVDGAPQADTWTYDGTTWTRLDVGGPAARSGAAAAWDPARARVVLFGGRGRSAQGDVTAYFADTWTWDGAAWTELELPRGEPELDGRAGAQLAWDGARLLLYGGLRTRPLRGLWTLTASAGWAEVTTP